jgi:hypothetical protein
MSSLKDEGRDETFHLLGHIAGERQNLRNIPDLAEGKGLYNCDTLLQSAQKS